MPLTIIHFVPVNKRVGVNVILIDVIKYPARFLRLPYDGLKATIELK